MSVQVMRRIRFSPPMICKHVFSTARGYQPFGLDNINGKYTQLQLARGQCARDELHSLVIQVVAECGSSCLGSSVGSLH